MKGFLLLVWIGAVCHVGLGIPTDTASDKQPTPTSTSQQSVFVGQGQYYQCIRKPETYVCLCASVADLSVADVNFFDPAVTKLEIWCHQKLASYNFPVFDSLPSFIKQLHVWDCFKEEIDKEVLNGLAHVELLDLTNFVYTNTSVRDQEGMYHFKPKEERINATMLDPELFSSVPQLTKLSLNWLFLEMFPEAIYHPTHGVAPLQNLEVLDIAQNRISDVRPHYFSNMKNLRWLDMSLNRLHNISDSLLMLQNLQQLYMKGNKIECLDGSPFKTLRKLGTLVLSVMWPFKNVTLPGVVGRKYPRRGSLQFVYPSAFVGLSNLKRLDLSGNSIRMIQNRTFAHLVKLEQLDLSFGLISTVEESGFGGLQSLTSLELSYNNLSYIGSSIFDNLPSLEKLNLEGNFLQSLSENDFQGLQSLTTLNIGYNSLRNIPKDAFRPLVNLKMLLLQHNHIVAIEGFISRLLSSYCEEINISCNNVSTLDASILPTLSTSDKTVALNISHNSITSVYASNGYFDANDIKWQQVVLTLDLRWNKFESLPFNLERFRFFSKHRIGIDENDVNRYYANSVYDDISLLLYPNPIICDCRIYELLQNRKTALNGVLYSKTDFDKLTCRSPENLQGEKLIHLRPSQAWCHYMYNCPSACTCMVQGEQNSGVSPWNERVDCSGGGLSTVPTGISSLTTILHMEKNTFRTIYRSTFIEGLMITELYLSYNNITEIKSMAFSRLKFLEILHLDGNNIDDIAGSEFLGIANLKELYLNRSRLRIVSSNAFVHLPSLKVLHLDNNLLTTLSKDLFSTLINLQRLALTGNSFRCDCDILWLKYWMKNKESILVRKNISCRHLQSQYKETIQILSEDTLGCDVTEVARKNKITISLSVVVVLLSLLIILGIWLYKRKEALQVYLYARYGWRFREEQEDIDKPYNAFLSYSQQDLDFIIHTLLPGLENREHPFRVCLHHRDFVPGIPIADNILNAVEESRRTIVVISRHFLESEWCQLEFQAAHAQVLQDRANRLIMILLEDIPVDDAPPEIRHYLKTNTYLKWGDERFWERLVYVMPRPRPPELLVENMEQEQLEMHEANEQEM